MDSVLQAQELELASHGWWDRDWFRRKLSDQHVIDYKGEDWSLFADPVYQVYGGKEKSDNQFQSIGANTRGVHVEGRLGSQFTFETTLIESQVYLQQYLNSYIQNRGVIPGEGIAKKYGTNGWDHRWASGNISYTPSKFFNISLGQGKFFYGEGYRSLLLSDNALNYPYLRVETTFGPFKYVNLWTQMYDIRREVNLNPGNRRKWISSHYLSWNLTDRFNVSFFEAVVYGSDTMNGGLDMSYFNPIIMYRPIEDQMDSRLGNVLLGLSSSYHFPKGHSVYGQFLFEEFNYEAFKAQNGSWLNKFGYQLGYSYQQTFGSHFVKARVEYNYVRPFVYTHSQVLTNYAHFSQPLAHPLGTGFEEVLFRLNWRKRKWSISAHYSYAQGGMPQIQQGTYYANGYDLWSSYNNRSRDEGYWPIDYPLSMIENARIDVAYMAQPAWKMEFFTQFGYRNGINYPMVSEEYISPERISTVWLSFGIRTQLYRTYTDI